MSRSRRVARTATAHLPVGEHLPVQYTSSATGATLNLSLAALTIGRVTHGGTTLPCSLWFEDFNDPSSGVAVVGELGATGLVLDSEQLDDHNQSVTDQVRDAVADHTLICQLLTLAVQDLPDPLDTGHSAQAEVVRAKNDYLRTVHAVLTAPSPTTRHAALAVLTTGYDGDVTALLTAATTSPPR